MIFTTEVVVGIFIVAIILLFAYANSEPLADSFFAAYEGLTGAPKYYKLTAAMSKDLGMTTATGADIAAILVKVNNDTGHPTVGAFMPELEVIRLVDTTGKQEYPDIKMEDITEKRT